MSYDEQSYTWLFLNITSIVRIMGPATINSGPKMVYVAHFCGSELVITYICFFSSNSK